MPISSQNKLSHEESLALYEQQVSFVRTVLNHDPNLLNIFSDEERSTFEKYFLPDWTEVGNFVHYFEQWEQKDPEMIDAGNQLLQKFLSEHKLSGPA
jgi:hypothetical protein